MKAKTWCLALAFCMLTLCSCSAPQSNATEMERAITSFLEEAEASQNADPLPSAAEGFTSYGTYRCASKYYSATFFKSHPEGIPFVTFNESGTCQLSVNYMEGVDVIGGVYTVEDKKITVTLTDYSRSIFYEGDGYLENTFVFTIVDDSNLTIEKGYYAVQDGDCFIKVTPIPEKPTAQEVPYVFVDFNGAPQKLILYSFKDAFAVLSACSTYLPVEQPYGKEEPSKLFPLDNYFLGSANLELEGQFLFRGTLQKSDEPQYDGWWIFTLTEDSAKAFPQISEVPHSNALYLPASVVDSATTHQGDIVEIALTKLFIRYGQGDMVHTGN